VHPLGGEGVAVPAHLLLVVSAPGFAHQVTGTSRIIVFWFLTIKINKTESIRYSRYYCNFQCCRSEPTLFKSGSCFSCPLGYGSGFGAKQDLKKLGPKCIKFSKNQNFYCGKMLGLGMKFRSQLILKSVFFTCRQN